MKLRIYLPLVFPVFVLFSCSTNQPQYKKTSRGFYGHFLRERCYCGGKKDKGDIPLESSQTFLFHGRTLWVQENAFMPTSERKFISCGSLVTYKLTLVSVENQPTTSNMSAAVETAAYPPFYSQKAGANHCPPPKEGSTQDFEAVISEVGEKSERMRLSFPEAKACEGQTLACEYKRL